MSLIQPLPLDSPAHINADHWAADGLVGAWLLNERSLRHHGKTDRSGSGVYTMVAGANPGILPTQFGPLQKWIGEGASLRSRMVVPYNVDVALGGVSKATWVLWMNCTDNTGNQNYNGQGRIMDADGGTGNNDWGWTVRLASAGTDRMDLSINATTGNWAITTANNFMSLNKWLRIVITMDGVVISFYRDGVFVENGDGDSGSSVINDNGGLELGIGCRPNAGQYQRNFEGFLLDLRVYKNVTWNAGQVAADYRDTFGLYRRRKRAYFVLDGGGAPVEATAPAVGMTITVPAVTAVVNVTATAPKIALTINVPAVTTVVNVTASAPKIGLVLTVPAVTAVVSVTASAPAIALTLTVPAVTTVVNVTAAAPKIAMTLNVPAVTTVVNVTAAAPKIALTINATAVTAVVSVTVTAPKIALTLTVPAVTTVVNVTAAAPKIGMTLNVTAADTGGVFATAPAVGMVVVVPTVVIAPNYNVTLGTYEYCAAKWNGVDAVFTCRVKAVSGSAYARLWDAVDGAAVVGSELVTASTSLVWLTSQALPLVDGREYTAQLGCVPSDSASAQRVSLRSA